jgi:hypothetical protein
MAHKVEAWKCDWCSKTSMNAGAMAGHEASCLDNPARRACKTCVHSGFKVIEHHHVDAVPGVHDEIDLDEKELWCFTLDMAMKDKPYYADCEMEYDWYGDGDAQPVAFTCEHYKAKEASHDEE